MAIEASTTLSYRTRLDMWMVDEDRMWTDFERTADLFDDYSEEDN